ncbi:Sodium/calcium exchanger protein-domain-containing protein [Aspergillus cavernicola]|uniref:Sodium/calcium exchanger protein-domain-containing protein n=1 Tax=Aspergillus cavernicola TaxID=176166 RepID=A0ABR4J3P0_9EURO
MFEDLTAIFPPASTRRKRRYSVRPFYWSLIIFSILATLSWGLRRWSSAWTAQNPSVHQFMKRENEPECRLVRNANDKCAFVLANCLDGEDGFFSYLQFYYCTLEDAKPLAFTIIIIWLSLLFSTIGIAASDFLCIDLSTLASFLGLSESLTGVTFLAFGNGSPDVFSTFAAMRSNSGSLAIGELIGAAGFITSVVAGSMALVRPFKVARRSFVRDVGYFVVAISFSMFLVADGHLHIWESAAMVALYCFYVVLVVTWHWYIVRRRRVQQRNMAARSHFHIPDNQELDIEEVEEDDPGVASESTSLLHGATAEDFNALESAGTPVWKDADEDDETRNRHLAEIRDNMRVYRPSARRRNTLNPIRPSLVGALEFQSVLSSLQRSRSHHRKHHSISLERYSDVPGSAEEHRLQPDNISIASHPQSNRARGNEFLSPDYGTSRTRAVSANDAVGLKLDTTLFPTDVATRPQLTVSRPSVDGGSNTTPSHALEPHHGADLTMSPISSAYSSRSPSPRPGSSIQNSTLLAPPDAFHLPNYTEAASQPRSPLQVSPMGTKYSASPQGDNAVSPSSPFPLLQDRSRSPSPRPPSVRLPPPFSPTESLQFHEGAFNMGSRCMTPVSWWPQSHSLLQPIISTLFPTLYGWTAKTFWEKLLGIVAAPSVFLLTITLPVVDPAPLDSTLDTVPVMVTSADGSTSATPIVRLPEDSPLLQAHNAESSTAAAGHGSKSQGRRRQRFDSELPVVQEPIDSPTPPREWCVWLVYAQLFTGPQFVALIAWSAIDDDMKARTFLLLSLCALLFSLIGLGALLISIRQTRGSLRQPPSSWRPILALLGFVVAIVWIATIATEVVNLLKTIGVILNISDSLLGLTVFAVGNSLGDLVANITVARLGYPVMALSACFGGPMLNILLGIGLGGLYMTLHAKKSQTIATADITYDIAVSKVLIISGATLLVTLIGLLIVVPWNNWRMDRRIGCGLIVLWCVSTLGNVIAEIVS